MDEKIKQKLKKKLEKEKKKLTKELSSFARRDPKMKGNWLTRISFLGFGRSHSDEAAERREEYENRLPIEHSLELRLKDVELASAKIEKGKYGKCEKCKKGVELKRLEAVPEARLCLKCGRMPK